MSSGISSGFPELSPFTRVVVYVVLTRSPVYSRYCYLFLPDLHVLGTPPAFVLSQDQTLRCKFITNLFDIDVIRTPDEFRSLEIRQYAQILFVKDRGFKVFGLDKRSVDRNPPI